MESLGLLAKDSSSLFSPRRDSGKGFLSPRYSGRGQDEVAFDEQLLIWPMSEFDNQPEAEALQQPSPKFSVASKSHQYRSKISSTKHKDRSVCSGVNNANLSLITDLRYDVIFFLRSQVHCSLLGRWPCPPLRQTFFEKWT